MATRSETVKLRLTPDELAAFQARAGALGMNLSDWIRSRCAEDSWPSTGPLAELGEEPFMPRSLQRKAEVERKVYDSEKPRAKRTEMCAHRRRPDEFCVKCD